jgi:hypothetical protein
MTRRWFTELKPQRLSIAEISVALGRYAVEAGR